MKTVVCQTDLIQAVAARTVWIMTYVDESQDDDILRRDERRSSITPIVHNVLTYPFASATFQRTMQTMILQSYSNVTRHVN
jgi:hypothetical protein